MKTGDVRDNRTGEIIHITYDVSTDECSVNGVKAERMKPLETQEGEIVLGIPDKVTPANILYHVVREDIKSLPDI